MDLVDKMEDLEDLLEVSLYLLTSNNKSIVAGSNGGQIPVEPSPIIEGPEGVHMVRLHKEVKRRDNND